MRRLLLGSAMALAPLDALGALERVQVMVVNSGAVAGIQLRVPAHPSAMGGGQRACWPSGRWPLS
ncbi:MAG: hypothetical protein P8R54_10095 [Myxococcota bacterium]|nr:hypothetical protein [Myxococcota bacterium]